MGYGRGDLNDPEPTFWNTSAFGEKLGLIFPISIVGGIIYGTFFCSIS